MDKIRWVVLVLMLVLMGVGVTTSNAQAPSFAVIPGVALGPIQLDMSFARAQGTLLGKPTRSQIRETTDLETRVVKSLALLVWDRVKSSGEGLLNVFIAADFADGRMLSVWGTDDRLAYRGKNISDLFLVDFFAALGPPDGVEATGPYSYMVVWNIKGIVVGFSPEGSAPGGIQKVRVSLIGVFRPGQYQDYKGE